MDKLDLILKAMEDQSKQTQRLEEKIDNGFEKLNGRVRKTENDVLRIKTVWTTGLAAFTFFYHRITG